MGREMIDEVCVDIREDGFWSKIDTLKANRYVMAYCGNNGMWFRKYKESEDKR